MTALYELFILGSCSPQQRAKVEERVTEAIVDFDLKIPQDFRFAGGSGVAIRDLKSTAVAIYFAGDPTIDQAAIDQLEKAKIPIIPAVAQGVDVATVLPPSIQTLNAAFLSPADPDFAKLVSAALECLGLLHQQRRVFVSYRRDESRSVAVQIHDELSGRGFDVFLDTHDIRPGVPFQEMLWHRLVDCDVVLMLDTPDYFSSKWTKQELGRALAQGIQVLRIIWPGHEATRYLSLSETVKLLAKDITAQGQLTSDIVDQLVVLTERLRSRSIASRHMSLAGKLHTEVERLGGTFEGIGAHRALAFTLPNGLELQAYPVVGVPTAETINDIYNKAEAAGHGRRPCLVYDHNGIRPRWLAHLKWLDEKIPEVRAVKVFDAAWELAEWDS